MEKNPSEKVYNFKRPDKFSKDQIRTLRIIHETFARLCTTSLSAHLRAMVHIRMEFIDQVTYEEFIRSVPSATALNIIRLNPLKGSMVIELGPDISFPFLDRLYGGKGEKIPENRELTDIERSLIADLAGKTAKNFRESWINVIKMEPELESIETNPQFAQIVPPNAMIILIGFNITMREVMGRMNIAIPYITLEPVMHKLSANYWYSGIKPERKNGNSSIVSRIKVESEVIIPCESISVRDLFGIRKGSMIRLRGFESGKAFLRSGGRIVAKFSQNKKDIGRNYNFIADAEENTGIEENKNNLNFSRNETTQNDNSLNIKLGDFSSEIKKSMDELVEKISGIIDKQNVLSEQISFNSSESLEIREKVFTPEQPFSFLNDMDPKFVGQYLSYEHPQLAALILSRIDKNTASGILSSMIEKAPEIIKRIVHLGSVSPGVIAAVEGVIRHKFSQVMNESYSAAGGVNTAAGILNHASRSVEKSVIGTLEKINPEIASGLKQNMFVFEDIIFLDDKSIRMILNEVENKTLAYALKSVNEKVVEFVFNHLPEKEIDALKSAMKESGQIKHSDIEKAQHLITGIISKLDESGEIAVFRTKEKIIE